MRELEPPIHGPADLKGMSLEDLQALAEDIRQAIVSVCLTNGGHLGASLGVVDLAIALHFVFESPREPLVWDVGHQAYAHKLLTGRSSRFDTLRLEGGLSGFLSREESEHDVFGAGHSSTALPAALGMAYARRGTSDWTVAVVGDGALTAGLALEALNNARSAPSGPLLLVLNDNQMSIAPNVGTLPQLFASGRSRELFELFGFDYVGPVDGHDLHTLTGTLQGIRASRPERPVVLHVLTQKGKGYVPAEESPAFFHGVSPLQEKVPGAKAPPKLPSWSDAFGDALCELAEMDPRVVAITAAMPEGTGLTQFARRFPDRFFDVGIAEPCAVTLAAGLAVSGLRPVVAIYSTFLQRALDSIIHDVALQGLGVTFAVDRAGLVGADGPTHHGMFDLAYLGMVPRLRVSAPACLPDLRHELAAAVGSGKPWAIRYPRGAALPDPGTPFEGSGAGEGMRILQRASKPRLIAVGLGTALNRLAQAAKQIDPSAESITAVAVVRAKPVPEALARLLKSHPGVPVVTLEDGVVRGGFGQSVNALLAGEHPAVTTLGYPDEFVPHGAPASLEDKLGLSVRALAERLRRMLEEAH